MQFLNKFVANDMKKLLPSVGLGSNLLLALAAITIDDPRQMRVAQAATLALAGVLILIKVQLTEYADSSLRFACRGLVLGDKDTEGLSVVLKQIAVPQETTFMGRMWAVAKGMDASTVIPEAGTILDEANIDRLRQALSPSARSITDSVSIKQVLIKAANMIANPVGTNTEVLYRYIIGDQNINTLLAKATESEIHGNQQTLSDFLHRMIDNTNFTTDDAKALAQLTKEGINDLQQQRAANYTYTYIVKKGGIQTSSVSSFVPDIWKQTWKEFENPDEHTLHRELPLRYVIQALHLVCDDILNWQRLQNALDFLYDEESHTFPLIRLGMLTIAVFLKTTDRTEWQSKVSKIDNLKQFAWIIAEMLQRVLPDDQDVQIPKDIIIEANRMRNTNLIPINENFFQPFRVGNAQGTIEINPVTIHQFLEAFIGSSAHVPSALYNAANAYQPRPRPPGDSAALPEPSPSESAAQSA